MPEQRTDYTVPADTVRAADLAPGDLVLVALPRQRLVVVIATANTPDGKVSLRLAARSPWAAWADTTDDLVLAVPARAEFTRTLACPF